MPLSSWRASPQRGIIMHIPRALVSSFHLWVKKSIREQSSRIVESKKKRISTAAYIYIRIEASRGEMERESIPGLSMSWLYRRPYIIETIGRENLGETFPGSWIERERETFLKAVGQNQRADLLKGPGKRRKRNFRPRTSLLCGRACAALASLMIRESSFWFFFSFCRWRIFYPEREVFGGFIEAFR